MSVVLSIEEIGPCKKQLRIEVPAPAVEAETDRVVGEFARKAKIPGFRKGKVPVAIVRRQFGEEIRREIVERIVPRYWRQAAAEHELAPLGPPRVESVDLKEGEAMTFSAVVEVRPEFELRNYTDFALPNPDVEPTVGEIERAIDDLRRRHAEWVEVARTAVTGDRAKIELSETEAAVGAAPQTAEIELGSPRIWAELNAAVTGLAPGQSAPFVRHEGEGESARQRRFEVRLTELREARLPAVDDAFAKHFGAFANAAEFEADVAGRIRTAKGDSASVERERALLDQLTERHPMPLPDGVVRSETEDLLREYAEGLSRRGVDLEKAQIDWQAIGEEARPHAERRVRARILLDAIAERERILVTEPEFESAIAVLARLQGVASGALRQRLDGSGELAGLRARMRREKTMRRLLGESPPPPTTAAE